MGNYENLCKRCGECCKIKNKINDTQYFEHNRYCKYLKHNKDGTKFCLIYKDVRKHQLLNDNKNICTSAKKGVEIGVMPLNCSYVKLIKNYKYNVIKKDDKNITK